MANISTKNHMQKNKKKIILIVLLSLAGLTLIGGGIALACILTSKPSFSGKTLISNKENWDNVKYGYTDIPTAEVDFTDTPENLEFPIIPTFEAGSAYFEIQQAATTNILSLKPGLVAGVYSCEVYGKYAGDTNLAAGHTSIETVTISVGKTNPTNDQITVTVGTWQSTATGSNKFDTTTDGCKVYLNYSSNEAPWAPINIAKPDDLIVDNVEIYTQDSEAQPDCFVVQGNNLDGYKIQLRSGLSTNYLSMQSVKAKIMVTTTETNNYYSRDFYSSYQIVQFLNGIIPSTQTTLGNWNSTLVYGYANAQATLSSDIAGWNNNSFPLTRSYSVVNGPDTTIPADKISIVNGNILSLTSGLAAGDYKVRIQTSISVSGSFHDKFSALTYSTDFDVNIAKRPITTTIYMGNSIDSTSSDATWLTNGVEHNDIVTGYLKYDPSTIPSAAAVDSCVFSLNTNTTTNTILDKISFDPTLNCITINANVSPNTYTIGINLTIHSNEGNNYVTENVVSANFNLQVHKAKLSTKGINISYEAFKVDFNDPNYQESTVSPIITGLPDDYTGGVHYDMNRGDIPDDKFSGVTTTGVITIKPGLPPQQDDGYYTCSVHPKFWGDDNYEEWDTTEPLSEDPLYLHLYLYCGIPIPIPTIFNMDELVNNSFGGRLFVPSNLYGTSGVVDYVKQKLLTSSTVYYDSEIDVTYPTGAFDPNLQYGNFDVTFTPKTSSTHYDTGVSVTIPCTYGVTPVMKDNLTTFDNKRGVYSCSQSSAYNGNRVAALAFRRSDDNSGGNDLAGWFSSNNYNTEDAAHTGFYTYTGPTIDHFSADYIHIHLPQQIHITGFQMFSRRGAGGGHYVPKWQLWANKSTLAITSKQKINEGENFTFTGNNHAMFYSSSISSTETFDDFYLCALEARTGSGARIASLGDLVIFGYP